MMTIMPIGTMEVMQLLVAIGRLQTGTKATLMAKINKLQTGTKATIMAKIGKTSQGRNADLDHVEDDIELIIARSTDHITLMLSLRARKMGSYV